MRGKKGNAASENVQVVVRCRPLSKSEIEHKTREIVHTNVADNSVTVNADEGTKTFSFDQIFNRSFTQKNIYLQAIHPLVESVLSGYNATVFAYGQSGTGKTYTMTGDITCPEKQGVIPHALQHIFQYIQNDEAAECKKEYSVHVSYVELYNGKCRDLLVDNNKENLEIKENEQKLFYVKGLEKVRALSVEQCLRLMEEGLNRREVGSTLLNQDSSRSHSVFSVEITCENHEMEGQSTRLTSKLNLVDLAGSERQSKTAAEGDRLKEGSNINLSLTALGTVIDVLVKGKGHIPFRSSPLTMLLKDSLGGSCRTVMFATCSPAELNSQETLSTLRFADRAKRIKNKPRVQMDPKDELIQKLRDENTALRAKLNGDVDPDSADSPEALQANYEALQVEVSALKSEVSSLQADVTHHQRRYAQLEESTTDAAEQTKLVAEDNAALTTKLKELSKTIMTFFHTALDDEEYAAWQQGHLGDAGAEPMLAPAAAAIGFNKIKTRAAKAGGSPLIAHYSAKSPARAHTFSDHAAPSPPATGRAERRRKKLANGMANGNGTHDPLSPSSNGNGHGMALPVVSDSSATTSPTPPAGPEDVVRVSPTKPKAAKPSKKRHLAADGAVAAAGMPNGVDGVAADVVEPVPAGKKEKKEKKKKKSSSRKPSSATSKEPGVMDSEDDGSGSGAGGGKNGKTSKQALKRELGDALGRLAETEGIAEQVARERDEALEQLSVEQAALTKMRQQAALKMKIVEELKEDISALSARLQDSSYETRLAVEHAQEQLIAENNRRHENLIKAHEKELQNARKAASEAKKKIKKIKEASGDLESKYDEKVVAFDDLLHDFEELKLQNMKMFQNGVEALTAGGPNDRVAQNRWKVNQNNVKLTSLDPAILGPIQQVLEQQRMTAKSAPLHHVLESFDVKDARARPMSSAPNPLNVTPVTNGGPSALLSPNFAKAPLPNIAGEEETPADSAAQPVSNPTQMHHQHAHHVMPVPQPPQSTRTAVPVNGVRKYD